MYLIFKIYCIIFKYIFFAHKFSGSYLPLYAIWNYFSSRNNQFFQLLKDLYSRLILSLPYELVDSYMRSHLLMPTPINMSQHTPITVLFHVTSLGFQHGRILWIRYTISVPYELPYVKSLISIFSLCHLNAKQLLYSLGFYYSHNPLLNKLDSLP